MKSKNYVPPRSTILVLTLGNELLQISHNGLENVSVNDYSDVDNAWS